MADLRPIVFLGDTAFPLGSSPRGSGSAGVAVVRQESDLASAFERASAPFEDLPDAGVVVEQFHDGPQFSVEAFSELGEHQVVYGVTAIWPICD